MFIFNLKNLTWPDLFLPVLVACTKLRSVVLGAILLAGKLFKSVRSWVTLEQYHPSSYVLGDIFGAHERLYDA